MLTGLMIITATHGLGSRLSLTKRSSFVITSCLSISRKDITVRASYDCIDIILHE